MHLIYHSIPLAVLLDARYKDFMQRFGPNIQHVLDCHETNEEVIARFKSQQLSSRHSLVCPSIIPLSPVAVRNYEQETRGQLKEWLKDVHYANARVGLVYNMYPAGGRGYDMSQVIGQGDMMNEAEQMITNEMKMIVDSLIKIKNANLTQEEKAIVDFTKIMVHPGD
jgi:hypothetical protein